MVAHLMGSHILRFGYPKSRQHHDATIDRLESGDQTPLQPSIKVLVTRCIVMVIYLLLGAVVFKVLEESREEDSLQRERQALRREFNISEARLRQFECFVRRYENKDWDYYQSLYFASTVTTTIGYGHITPHTQNGRVFLIIFALIGIPLNILALAAVGEHITVAIYHFLRYISVKCFGKRRINHINIKVMLVSVVLMIFMLFIGGLLYCSTEEEWSYIDSIYYCFVAMATIGFGDLVPNRGLAPDSDKEKAIWFLRFTYLSIGLSLVSTVFTALSNAMEEINFLLKRNKKNFNRKNNRGEHHPNNRKFNSEKICYGHKIKKHGSTVLTYKILQKLKRKKECDFSHVDWDSLLEEAKRKETAGRLTSKSSPNNLQKPPVLLFTDNNADTMWLSGTPEPPETSSSRVTESNNNSPSSTSKTKYTYNNKETDNCDNRVHFQTDNPHHEHLVHRVNENCHSRHLMPNPHSAVRHTENRNNILVPHFHYSRQYSAHPEIQRTHKMCLPNDFKAYGSLQRLNQQKKFSPPLIRRSSPNDFDVVDNQC